MPSDEQIAMIIRLVRFAREEKSGERGDGWRVQGERKVFRKA